MPELASLIAGMLLVSLVGGAISLDRASVLQIMISRPLVAAPITGLILGNLEVGIKAGFVLELLWISSLPVGASIPPDDTVVSILTTAITIFSVKLLGGDVAGLLALALIVTIPAAIMAQRMDAYIREKNILSAHKADVLASEFDIAGVERECLKGIKRFYTGYTVFVFLSLLAGLLLVRGIYPLLSDGVINGLRNFYYMLPIIGLASLCSSGRGKYSFNLFVISFIVFLLLLRILP